MNKKEQQKFKENCTGIFKPEKALKDHIAVEAIQAKWENATYNKAYNNQMARQEINQMRNK